MHREVGLLRQISNRSLPPPRDTAFIGGIDAYENPCKGGLARAIRSHESNALTLVNRHVDAVEEDHVAVRFPEVFCDDDGHPER